MDGETDRWLDQKQTALGHSYPHAEAQERVVLKITL